MRKKQEIAVSIEAIKNMASIKDISKIYKSQNINPTKSYKEMLKKFTNGKHK